MIIMVIWGCNSEEPFWANFGWPWAMYQSITPGDWAAWLEGWVEWWALMLDFQIGLTTSSISM